MNLPFHLNSIANVEFCIGITNGDQTDLVLVPVDEGVKELLPEILSTTLTRLQYEERATRPMDKLELAEKYAASERLVASMLEPYMDVLRNITAAANIPSSASVMDKAESISFYFARFTDSQRRRLFAFRRASTFKAVLRARHRLIQVVDDTLRLVDDNIFRLDETFDFITAGNECLILHYTGFEQLAEIQKVVAQKASSFVDEIAGKSGFIHKDRLGEYVRTHPRAAKLVAAIRSRGDLDRLSEKKVKALCKKNGIQTETIDGLISPRPGFEIAFLEVLDRRRYNLSLIDKENEFYVATSRKGVPLPNSSEG